MDFERDHVLLNGAWERMIGQPDAEMWAPAAPGNWEPISLPGVLDPGRKRPENEQVQCVWLRRTFALDARQAARQAVLKWGHARFGASAWLNGAALGSHATVGPAGMLVPAGTARAGENVLVLKVNGWAGLHKSAKGAPVIPVGADMHWGGRGTTVNDDVWLEFYNRAHLDRVLAMPDPAAGTVTFRVRPDSAVDMPKAMDLAAEVRFADRNVGGASARMATGDGTIALTVRLSEVKEWTPAEPRLYTARLALSADGRPCDEVSFRFGMRTIGVRAGHYEMNGRPLWFRGSNLVNEWNWGDTFNREIKRYVVDEARSMNLDCFRTHTLPPPTPWLDVCDEYGTMILAEFSTTFNYQDFGFTPEEWEMWHRNSLADATGWITKIWNHPSVVMWVLTNESRSDNEWEAGPYHDAVLALDPTRPTMRTGETQVGTAEVVDVHTCGNYCYGPNNYLITTCRALARDKDPARALGNSEYMNYLGRREDSLRRRLGSENPADAALDFAECAAEHTEAMRQVNFDMILPYMYAGWPRFRGNNWRPDYPTPMAAALHSSMAPVLASLDLFDRNFVAGRPIATPLHLINELHQDVAARMDCYITRQNPLFVPDAGALESALWHESRSAVLKADSHTVDQLQWPLSGEVGTYYLAVVLTREGNRPVVSQRPVRLVAEPTARPELQGRRLLVLGADEALERWFSDRVIPHQPLTAQNAADGDVLLIWNAKDAPAGDLAPVAMQVAESGGRVIMMPQRQGEYAWPVPFRVENTESSGRVFPYPGIDHPMLRGIDPECLKGWNGLPNLIVSGHLAGEAADGGRKLLWADNPQKPVAVSLARGKGEVIIVVLQFDGRLSRQSERYDPAAEQVLLNMLAP